jgi:hypothetical protein
VSGAFCVGDLFFLARTLAESKCPISTPVFFLDEEAQAGGEPLQIVEEMLVPVHLRAEALQGALFLGLKRRPLVLVQP